MYISLDYWCETVRHDEWRMKGNVSRHVIESTYLNQFFSTYFHLQAWPMIRTLQLSDCYMRKFELLFGTFSRCQSEEGGKQLSQIPGYITVARGGVLGTKSKDAESLV